MVQIPQRSVCSSRANDNYGPLLFAMYTIIQPFHLLVIALAGWLNRDEKALIDYLIAENRVLKDQTRRPASSVR